MTDRLTLTYQSTYQVYIYHWLGKSSEELKLENMLSSLRGNSVAIFPFITFLLFVVCISDEISSDLIKQLFSPHEELTLSPVHHPDR